MTFLAALLMIAGSVAYFLVAYVIATRVIERWAGSSWAATFIMISAAVYAALVVAGASSGAHL